ncbi:iron reductase domain protein, partial [Plenodomus tracheiphilus IPT5]
MVNFRARVLGWVGLAAVFFPTLIVAQNSTTPVSASTFWLEETETQFSVNVANDSSDVFLYFSSPAYSWVGFGFGGKMENSLMFIMYPNAKGDNITISPRLGSTNSEPTFHPTITLDILPETQINDSQLILAARCRNCRVWPNGFLDVNSQAQPMIYAFGPGLQSNSPSANLKRHVRYGKFSLNMLAATGTGGVPSQSSAQNGVAVMGNMTKDSDRKKLAHAVLGCVALFVLWPLNMVVAGFFKNIRIHGGVSGLIVVCLMIAYALGITTSGEYNRSKTYSSPHQILAFISLFPLTLLSLLPIPKISTLHPKFPSLHTPLSTLTLASLVLTGGLGLHLGMQTRPIILSYTALTLLIFVFCVSLGYCIRRRGSAHARANRRGVRLGSSSLEGDRHDDDREMMLSKIGGGNSSSFITMTPVPPAYAGYGERQQLGRHASREFGAEGQRGVYGGGAMPGPQYLLNMHPGVPVQVSRM